MRPVTEYEAAMFNLLVALSALSAPPPASPSSPPPIGIQAAGQFALPVADLAERVRATYSRPVGYDALALAAARGLYRTAGERPPAGMEGEARKVTSKTELTAFLAAVRLGLGDRPALAESRDYLAAVGGFSDALDPYCDLVLDSGGGSTGRANIEAVLGIEFAGPSNAWWVHQFVLQDPHPGPFNGTVGRVAPGGFAARNALKPGDRIVSIDGMNLEPRKFAELAQRIRSTYNLYLSSRNEDDWKPAPRIPLTFERDGIGRTVACPIDKDPEQIESVFGVGRTDKGEWTYLLPTPSGRPKLGFIRLGPLDYGIGAQLGEALDHLKKESAEGVVLDLRGCPGGYLNEATLIAGHFLASGRTIYRSKTPTTDPSANGPVKSPAGNPDSYGRTVPLVVLVDGTTQGGGELLAAALQDNKRAVVTGGRTFGKGLILGVVATSFQGLSYRVSSGVCLRPDGTDRHRYPTSKPTDPWGVRPDAGFEFETSRDYAEQVNGWYELRAIRPPKSTDAQPLDDPLNDPALQFAIRKLGEAVRKKSTKN